MPTRAQVPVLDGHNDTLTQIRNAPEAEARIKRVLTNDPGTGVMRHVDAGYEKAVDVAKERGVKVPMMK